MMKKHPLTCMMCLCLLILIRIGTFYLHPSLEWSASSSKLFTSAQLSHLAHVLLWKYAVSLDNTVHIRSTYDEELTHDLITYSILATQCRGQDSFCDTLLTLSTTHIDAMEGL